MEEHTQDLMYLAQVGDFGLGTVVDSDQYSRAHNMTGPSNAVQQVPDEHGRIYASKSMLLVRKDAV